MLSAAGAKHLLLLSCLVTNASALVILSAVRREGPALGMPDAKAGPSLRAPTARFAQDDKPRVFEIKEEETEENYSFPSQIPLYQV